MNSNLTYEIKAEAFRLMTGLMAPGKDMPSAANESEEERKDREEAWQEWLTNNGGQIAIFLMASQNVGAFVDW